MASNFYMPEWAFAPPSPPEPPPLPTASDLNIPVEAYAASTSYAMDPTLELGPSDWDEVDRANAARVDELNNEFIDRQSEILHDGDNAFFKQTGRDAILNARAIHARLDAARQETLDRAANGVQREWLGETLGKHKIVEHFDIGDHVGRQSLVWQKSINRGRLDRLNRQAGIDHADPRMIEALANASESSARDHARASGFRPDSPEAQVEVDIARSSIFRHAIEGALDKGAHAVAIKLHERAKDKLIPGDAELLDTIIEDAREIEVGREYVARVAPLSLTINTSVEDLDKAEAEATAKNNADWKDNDSQRATIQHFIDIQFGEAKRQIEEDKAKLIRSVHDWLTTPGPDGLPRIERPPIAIWARLTPEERKRVDKVLEQAIDTMIGSVAKRSEIMLASHDAGSDYIGGLELPPSGLPFHAVPQKPAPLPPPPPPPEEGPSGSGVNLRVIAEEYRKLLEEEHKKALENYEKEMKEFMEKLPPPSIPRYFNWYPRNLWPLPKRDETPGIEVPPPQNPRDRIS